MPITRQDALDYHALPQPGKISTSSTKPCRTQRDLSLAYTPGVAEPCNEIAADPEKVYKYTSRGNLVAVVSNGTAVLGLGNIGPLAGKPVMEGKSVLFKRFADIDVFDLELNTLDPDEIIRTCQLLEPTFGGINLEDIKAPECFYIEERLKQTMGIPVFHDDQHGTAIISGAALINALEITKKNIRSVRIVINGSGAAGIACASHYLRLGAPKENIILCDTKGVIHKGRTDNMNPYKKRFAVDTPARTLAEAVKDADVLIGVSVKGAVTSDMVRSMAPNPIVFALANPDPEITYAEALAARPDVIMATGRSDYPNQVNNVLGFPFIFRGALDTRAKAITEEMMLAATYALSSLAKEDVPDSVCGAYGVEHLCFGPEYLIPKPFDPRAMAWVASGVARAAMESGVARHPLDIRVYREELERRLGKAHEVMRMIIQKAQADPKSVVFSEGENDKVLRACHALLDENIAHPILLGDEVRIREHAAELGLRVDDALIVNPAISPLREPYIDALYELRQRKGVTRSEARDQISNRNVFAAMMVHMSDADALVSGVTQHYPDTIRPALQIVKVREGINKVSALHGVITRKGEMYFLADVAVNIEPTAEELAEIALCAAQEARRFEVEPRLAMLSFSNFGSSDHPLAAKVRKAVELVRKADPKLIIDGEMAGDTAVVPEIIEETYPFSTLHGGANVLIFPDLQSANITYKLLARLGGAEVIGPILMGMSKPVHVLQRGASVEEIVNIAAVAVVDAQELERYGVPVPTLALTPV